MRDFFNRIFGIVEQPNEASTNISFEDNQIVIKKLEEDRVKRLLKIFFNSMVKNYNPNEGVSKSNEQQVIKALSYLSDDAINQIKPYFSDNKDTFVLYTKERDDFIKSLYNMLNFNEKDQSFFAKPKSPSTKEDKKQNLKEIDNVKNHLAIWEKFLQGMSLDQHQFTNSDIDRILEIVGMKTYVKTIPFDVENIASVLNFARKEQKDAVTPYQVPMILNHTSMGHWTYALITIDPKDHTVTVFYRDSKNLNSTDQIKNTFEKALKYKKKEISKHKGKEQVVYFHSLPLTESGDLVNHKLTFDIQGEGKQTDSWSCGARSLFGCLLKIKLDGLIPLPKDNEHFNRLIEKDDSDIKKLVSGFFYLIFSMSKVSANELKNSKIDVKAFIKPVNDPSAETMLDPEFIKNYLKIEDSGNNKGVQPHSQTQTPVKQSQIQDQQVQSQILQSQPEIQKLEAPIQQLQPQVQESQPQLPQPQSQSQLQPTVQDVNPTKNITETKDNLKKEIEGIYTEIFGKSPKNTTTSEDLLKQMLELLLIRIHKNYINDIYNEDLHSLYNRILSTVEKFGSDSDKTALYNIFRDHVKNSAIAENGSYIQSILRSLSNANLAANNILNCKNDNDIWVNLFNFANKKLSDYESVWFKSADRKEAVKNMREDLATIHNSGESNQQKIEKLIQLLEDNCIDALKKDLEVDKNKWLISSYRNNKGSRFQVALDAIRSQALLAGTILSDSENTTENNTTAKHNIGSTNIFTLEITALTNQLNNLIDRSKLLQDNHQINSIFNHSDLKKLISALPILPKKSETLLKIYEKLDNYWLELLNKFSNLSSSEQAFAHLVYDILGRMSMVEKALAHNEHRSLMDGPSIWAKTNSPTIDGKTKSFTP